MTWNPKFMVLAAILVAASAGVARAEEGASAAMGAPPGARAVPLPSPLPPEAASYGAMRPEDVPPAPALPVLPDGDAATLPPVTLPPAPADVAPGAEVAPPTLLPLERRSAPRAGLFGWCCPPVDPRCCLKRDECGRRLDECGRPLGRWDVTLEGLFTFPEDPEGEVGVPIANSLTWDPHSYDGEFGVRLTVSYEVSPCDRVEFRGAYMGTWSDGSVQRGVVGFFPPVGGASAVLDSQLHSRADLWTGELNWWRQLCCRGATRADMIVGLRLAAFDESATLSASSLPPPGGNPIDGYVHGESQNRFYMLQAGGAVRHDFGRRVEVGASAKALAGIVDRDVEVEDNNIFAGGAHADSDGETDFAWGFELEAYGLIRVTSRVAVTVGYSMLYLDAVVRAHDGLDFMQATTGAVQARQGTSGLLVHTLFAGVRVNL